ncbi:hypothetical protein ABZP36_008510 [Zizania latifolia]
MGASYRDYIDIVFENSKNEVQSWHIDGYAFWVAGMDGGKWSTASRQSYNLRDAVSWYTVRTCISWYMRDLATLVVAYGISINLVEVTWKSKLKAQVRTAIKVKAAAILVFTFSGRAARLVAKYRPPMPVLVVVFQREGSDLTEYGSSCQLGPEDARSICLREYGSAPDINIYGDPTFIFPPPHLRSPQPSPSRRLPLHAQALTTFSPSTATPLSTAQALAAASPSTPKP